MLAIDIKGGPMLTIDRTVFELWLGGLGRPG